MELTPYQRDRIVRTILGEAANQGPEGMAAVANVILNRTQSGDFPSNPVSVVNQHDRRGYYAFTANAPVSRGGNTVGRNASASSALYRQAAAIVDQVFSGQLPDNTGGATYYHTADTATPASWTGLGQTARIGDHVFFSPAGTDTDTDTDTGAANANGIADAYVDATAPDSSLYAGIYQSPVASSALDAIMSATGGAPSITPVPTPATAPPLPRPRPEAFTAGDELAFDPVLANGSEAPTFDAYWNPGLNTYQLSDVATTPVQTVPMPSAPAPRANPIDAADPLNTALALKFGLAPADMASTIARAAAGQNIDPRLALDQMAAEQVPYGPGVPTVGYPAPAAAAGAVPMNFGMAATAAGATAPVPLAADAAPPAAPIDFGGQGISAAAAGPPVPMDRLRVTPAEAQHIALGDVQDFLAGSRVNLNAIPTATQAALLDAMPTMLGMQNDPKALLGYLQSNNLYSPLIAAVPSHAPNLGEQAGAMISGINLPPRLPDDPNTWGIRGGLPALVAVAQNAMANSQELFRRPINPADGTIPMLAGATPVNPLSPTSAAIADMQHPPTVGDRAADARGILGFLYGGIPGAVGDTVDNKDQSRLPPGDALAFASAAPSAAPGPSQNSQSSPPQDFQSYLQQAALNAANQPFQQMTVVPSQYPASVRAGIDVVGAPAADLLSISPAVSIPDITVPKWNTITKYQTVPADQPIETTPDAQWVPDPNDPNGGEYKLTAAATAAATKKVPVTTKVINPAYQAQVDARNRALAANAARQRALAQAAAAAKARLAAQAQPAPLPQQGAGIAAIPRGAQPMPVVARAVLSTAQANNYLHNPQLQAAYPNPVMAAITGAANPNPAGSFAPAGAATSGGYHDAGGQGGLAG